MCTWPESVQQSWRSQSIVRSDTVLTTLLALNYILATAVSRTCSSSAGCCGTWWKRPFHPFTNSQPEVHTPRCSLLSLCAAFFFHLLQLMQWIVKHSRCDKRPCEEPVPLFKKAVNTLCGAATLLRAALQPCYLLNEDAAVSEIDTR